MRPKTLAEVRRNLRSLEPPVVWSSCTDSGGQDRQRNFTPIRSVLTLPPATAHKQARRMTRITAPIGKRSAGSGRRRLWRALGPGLITGAADDDPSGIATYCQAGAQLGYAVNWTMLLSFPLMVAVQEISARIGRTTGRGIAGNIRKHYPGWLLQPIVVLLLIANTINIGADLGAMGNAAAMLAGGPQLVYVLGFGILCTTLEIAMPYGRYAAVLKWLTLALFAYFGTLMVINVPWQDVAIGLVLPTFSWQASFWTMVLAIFGTTISPYLFFWQASQEVEETEAAA